MRRMLAPLTLGLVLPAMLLAQPRPPAFLEAENTAPRVVTPHLEAQAQAATPVAADGRAAITVLVRPAPKMHVYAADVTGYVPLSLSVQPTPGVTAGKPVYPASELYVFPPTGESSRAYMQPFTVRQPLTVGAEVRRKLAGGTRVPVKLTLRYQACDDAVCYRPTLASLVVDLGR